MGNRASLAGEVGLSGDSIQSIGTAFAVATAIDDLIESGPSFDGELTVVFFGVLLPQRGRPEDWLHILRRFAAIIVTMLEKVREIVLFFLVGLVNK